MTEFWEQTIKVVEAQPDVLKEKRTHTQGKRQRNKQSIKTWYQTCNTYDIISLRPKTIITSQSF